MYLSLRLRALVGGSAQQSLTAFIATEYLIKNGKITSGDIDSRFQIQSD
jgi:hypothetical protein